MTLKKIERFLAEAGMDKTRRLNAQIWIRDFARDFEGMTEVWDAWVAPACGPTLATAQCTVAEPGTPVEIVVAAAAIIPHAANGIG